MNCWEALGIPPTGDARAIKKAYARLLRKFPPESDPEGFKNLRTAYEEALFLLQYGLIESAPPETPGAAPGPPSAEASGSPGEPVDGGGPPDPALPAPDGFSLVLPEPTPPHAEAEAVLARIRRDFSVDSLRESQAYWKELADSELLWDLAAKAEVGDGLFRFLGETYQREEGRYTSIHVPRESWLELDGAFGWLENEGEWYARYPEDLANAVLDRIRSARGMAQSTDLKGAYQPARGLLVEDSDLAGKYRWVGGIIGILAILALNGVFFRCS